MVQTKKVNQILALHMGFMFLYMGVAYKNIENRFLNLQSENKK